MGGLQRGQDRRSFFAVHRHGSASSETGIGGSTLIGSLIFGAGFAILGYCPGTMVGAVGQGSLDALFGGIPGMLLGAGLFAALYSRLESTVLSKGAFGELTLPQLLKVHPWWVIVPVAVMIIVLFALIESSGL